MLLEPGDARQLSVIHSLSASNRLGIGPDAEVFTKAPVLASMGCGEDIGIRSDSAWNNPEPEVVLAVSSDGSIKGAMLGNDAPAYCADY